MDNVKPARRLFFMRSGGMAAAVAGSALLPLREAHAADAAAGSTTLAYPDRRVAAAAELPVNKVSMFNYPDEDSPCYLLRMGEPVPGGVGPDGDIVAYSAFCTHMGCPVQYDGDTRTFKCGCHFSIFDPETGGQMVSGQATENLPRIVLHYDTKTGGVHAVGVDGLIYGRQSNIL